MISISIPISLVFISVNNYSQNDDQPYKSAILSSTFSKLFYHWIKLESSKSWACYIKPIILYFTYDKKTTNTTSIKSTTNVINFKSMVNILDKILLLNI